MLNNLLQFLKKSVYGLGELVYPENCAVCGTLLLQAESAICLSCVCNLPQTGYHQAWNRNPVFYKFGGKFELTGAFAGYFFHKGNAIQQIIHQAKYNKSPELFLIIGEIYGQILLPYLSPYSDAVLIPIPLHPEKLRKRTYNQAEYFARGLAKSLPQQLQTNLLFRKINTSSQTRKTRIERWKNVENVFDAESCPGQPCILIDDVITTGATTEAAARALLHTGAQVKFIIAIAAAR